MVSGRNAAPLESAAEPGDWRPLVLANASGRLVEYEGNRYALKVWAPATPTPVSGHPVIYVLDGDELFLSFAETTRRLSRFPKRTGIKPAAIVGITPYAEGDSQARYRHYTFGPPADSSSVPANIRWGEGDKLIAFIADALPRMISEHTLINASQASIYGHSLSAYFALYAATRHTFRTCGAISPSLWWDEASILDQVGRLANTRILLAHGEREAELSEPHRQSRAMDRRLKTLEEALSQIHPPACLATHVFAREDHGSVATVAIPEFLRFCMSLDE